MKMKFIFCIAVIALIAFTTSCQKGFELTNAKVDSLPNAGNTSKGLLYKVVTVDSSTSTVDSIVTTYTYNAFDNLTGIFQIEYAPFGLVKYKTDIIRDVSQKIISITKSDSGFSPTPLWITNDVNRVYYNSSGNRVNYTITSGTTLQDSLSYNY